jgi:nicotinate-nucleotide pyrophosphorylase (carboxylating)
VEVEDLDQLDQALQYSADTVMLDNFTLAELIEAVRITKKRTKLEASGGIDENTLVKVAETGVDYISIGALTKNCLAIDLSLLIKSH